MVHLLTRVAFAAGLLLIGAPDASADHPRVGLGGGVGGPALIHLDVSVWPLRYVTLDGRVWTGLSYGAEVAATARIPIVQQIDFLVSAKGGLGQENFFCGLSPGCSSFQYVGLAGGLGLLFSASELRLDLGAFRVHRERDDEIRWGVTASLTVLWNPGRGGGSDRTNDPKEVASLR